MHPSNSTPMERAPPSLFSSTTFGEGFSVKDLGYKPSEYLYIRTIDYPKQKPSVKISQATECPKNLSAAAYYCPTTAIVGGPE